MLTITLCISGFTFLYVSCMCMYDVCIRRSKRVILTHTYNIHTHISIHMRMYVHVFACMWVTVGVCMCMYEVICCAYIPCLCYIACICLYFLQPKLLVTQYAQHTGDIHTYIQIQQKYNRHIYRYIQEYMQIHAKYIHQISAQKVNMLLIKCYI